jgi:hypothetical protein
MKDCRHNQNAWRDGDRSGRHSHPGKFDDSELEVHSTNSKPTLNASGFTGTTRSGEVLKEIIDFNEQYRDREMPLLRPGSAGQSARRRTFD